MFKIVCDRCPPNHVRCFRLVNSIIVYIVQIYIGLFGSFLRIPILSFYFIAFHVWFHKLLNFNITSDYLVTTFVLDLMYTIHKKTI